MNEIIRKILIIDDEEANVRVLSLTLRCDGYKVVCALSGEEGLEVFRKESPDLVLTDIKMPGMDGIEVLKHIKKVSPDTEVIIITGHGDIDNAIEALKFGASDFINKPIRDKILAVAIQRAGERLSIKRQLAEYTVTLEQKVQQATEELRRQSNFLTRLIRSSNDGIVATDKDLNIVIFNPGAERIFGYTAEEVIRKQKITDLLPDSLKNIMAIPIRRAQSGTEALWQEQTICGKDQQCIPVRLYVTSLTEKEHVMGTVFFFQDLREIKRLEDELVHAERLAAIGQTVAGVAHGIKNILHGFKGGSYLVDLGIAKNDQEKLTKGWDMIQRNIVRTSELVLDLLSYSKERALEFEPCEPNRIVQEICDMMQHLAEQYHVELVTDLDPSMNEIYMDPAVVHQCLSNLVSNAVDACLFDHDTSKHYQVRIRTQRCSDGYIRFEIIDNGTGMSPEVRRKLFTSFFSTKGHRGTGLGLLVTRKLIQEHNGTITVASEQGKGTTFVIRLPYAVSKPE
ncbi:MAG: histidine kinase [Desulfatitalea sp. BRH_c12]|nr:MAG: histidine kinase [Desulfatitalea sp. BRH_c12]